LVIFQRTRGEKTIFFQIFPWNSVWKSTMNYFFWTTYQGLRRGQSIKSEDFDQNTKSGLKSSLLSFIYREMAPKWSQQNSLYDFGIKLFLWFVPFRYQHTLWFFCHARNLTYKVFIIHQWCINVLNQKNLNALWVCAILQAIEVDLFDDFCKKHHFWSLTPLQQSIYKI